MITVKDKVVIITGAGQGLGRGYAETLAADGAKVVVAEIDTKTGEEVARGIKAKVGEAIFVATDVSKYDTVDRMVKTTIKTYGRIDALVNNAARFDGLKGVPFYEITEEEWDYEFAVNVKGTWNCCRAVFSQFRRQKKGKIINVASSLAFEGGGQFLHYVATKGAIVSLTRALATEISRMPEGSAITVNALAPGAIFDEACQRLAESFPGGPEEQKQHIVAGQTVNRLGMVEDVVGAVLFMVSDASNFMDRSILCVDGGSSRH